MYAPAVTLDGYDKIIMSKKYAEIVDDDVLTKGKLAQQISSRKAFWVSFLKKSSFSLAETTVSGGNIARSSDGGTSRQPTTNVYTFIKD